MENSKEWASNLPRAKWHRGPRTYAELDLYIWVEEGEA